MYKLLALSMMVAAMTGCTLDDSEEADEKEQTEPAAVAAPAPPPPPAQVSTGLRPMLKTRH